MVTMFGTFILLMIVLVFYRKLNNRYQEAKYRFELHRVRHRLRLKAVEKVINTKSKEFDYLDFSISKSIQESYYISLFYILSLYLVHRSGLKDIDKYKSAYETLNKKIAVNGFLGEINRSRNAAMYKYVMNQNKITRILLKYMLFIFSTFSSLKKKTSKLIYRINYLPETSGIASAC